MCQSAILFLFLSHMPTESSLDNLNNHLIRNSLKLKFDGVVSKNKVLIMHVLYSNSHV